MFLVLTSSEAHWIRSSTRAKLEGLRRC